MSTVRRDASVSLASLLLPIGILCVLTAAAVVVVVGDGRDRTAIAAPTVITVPPHAFRYRPSGEYHRFGIVVDAPETETRLDHPMTITKYQITAAEYDRCVADRACKPREGAGADTDTRIPAIGIDHDDAAHYADWLGRRTGTAWRLPTDRELAAAAGSKFPDDALGIDPEARNPALRWLADYRREAERKAPRDPRPHPLGSFGESEWGLADFGGNVWEWTTTCNRRVDLDATGAQAGVSESCGIYVASGRHRAQLSSFIREPKSGGCSVGTPPDNLGFRLVREGGFFTRLAFAVTPRRP